MAEKLIIAGPCSAESRGQVLETAGALKELGVCAFRAGLWKPRTHPGSFEGVGERGIEWLLEVRKETGLRVCTEVGSAAHARLCMDAGIDMVWIGARTTANPFLVQEIARAMEGSGVGVLVKNPVSPDPELWIGAIERLSAAGLKIEGAVLRGYKTPETGLYRNAPGWELFTCLRSRLPDIPVLVDPSHIGGDAKYVRELVQRAYDLGMDGMMTEVHPCPQAALSDAAQQLSPLQFGELLSGLKVRLEQSSDQDFTSRLEELRLQIDSIDSQLLSLLQRRMDISRQIGLLKRDHSISILQSGRWEDILVRLREESAIKGLDPSLTEKVFNIIHEYSLKVQ